ncbi:FAD-binding oxidoreductase [Leptospira noguchii]|uniref:FAD-dependent oxidoreductase n=1 Tax=Leptospira noguchii TaxID=28182 RepID=UPI001F0548DF|nr:FAD-binding oxidoreductase [Leptospira noguchii]MCH1912622.1 FAD-binding oxidoreductase [Leptospira noguchii]MCH1916330.1 FAD-binding oxidoreductase [Leptospira noguchii]UOG63681.1 FAD-binding oxidoreductase [Leptospira noguchii]
MKKFVLLFFVFVSLIFADPEVVNDVTQINPIRVNRVVTPTTLGDIQELIKNHSGPISIGGGRFSMGGQIATENALFIDTREFNKILSFDPRTKLITVESGITWRKLQESIDPFDLSVQIKQTYSNFTIGGSLSVNAHGRYVGYGPMILSVRSIKLVLSDGKLVTASPKENPEIFFASVGGYGGIGVIVEVTLELTENKKIKRFVKKIPITEYKNFFFKNIRNNPKAQFHNGDIYPPAYENVNTITWEETEEAVTVNDRIVPVKESYWLENLIYFWLTELPYGKELREAVLDPLYYRKDRVLWRNYEASYDVQELEPPNRRISTYVLQEYFIPVEKFDEFYPLMKLILQKHDVNVVNISIRHAKQDSGSYLVWARTEVFSFVIYYKQRVYESAKREVGVWTRELIDAVISVGGTYYLPYQLHATVTQFHKAYPNANRFFALKRKLDPKYKFRNKLWDKYYFHNEDDQKIRLTLDSLKDYTRNEDQTFLTLPEWYIVFSSDEYANFLMHSRPSAFPYFGSIAQFWKMYGRVIVKTWNDYEFNWGYHLMINVIGVSYSAELMLKSLYENTFGRCTEWIAGTNGLTSETNVEAYMQKVARDYTDFVRLRPWYEYPFYSKFKEFWTIRDGDNTSFVRRWERRFFFSTELLVKALYGKLIALGTESVYAPETFEVKAWVVENGKGTIRSIPRYEAFTKAVPEIVKKNVSFVEIAGNRKILMTLIVPSEVNLRDREEVLYEWNILTEPNQKRVAVVAPVSRLHEILINSEKNGFKVDHIFDY